MMTSMTSGFRSGFRQMPELNKKKNKHIHNSKSFRLKDETPKIFWILGCPKGLSTSYFPQLPSAPCKKQFLQGTFLSHPNPSLT